jgi:hypothetical protein
MKLKLTPVVATLCILGFCSAPAFADTAGGDQTEMIKKLSERTEMLESQLGQLQGEIKNLKKAERKASKVRTVTVVQPAATPTAPSGAVPVALYSDKPSYSFGTPITTSPYIGVASKFDASDIMSIKSLFNQDLAVLKQVNKMRKGYAQNNWSFPNHPFVNVSGKLQLTGFQQKPFAGRRNSDIDFTGAELDIMPVFNQWVSGYMMLDYDASPQATGPRASNSRFAMNNGYIVIGNLSQSPFYATLGQLWVPFGQYSNYMIDDPVTKYLGKTKGRAVVLGYDQEGEVNGLNATAYAFKGDSNTFASSSKVNQFGGNIDYMLTQPNWNGDLAVGYITNIADSAIMQSNGGDSGSFQGFGSNSGETLVHRVPGLDVHTLIAAGNFDVIAEYVTATTSFASNNMTFNGVGAKPSAFHTEFDYTLPVSVTGPKTTILSVGYDQTKEALALLLPKQSYFTMVNTSLWRDTVEGLEYRHDINYASSSSASGQNTAVAASGLGHSADTLFLQLTAYF